MDIRLIPTEDIETIILLLKTLDPSLSESVLQQRLAAMVQQGYRCAGAYDDSALVGCCGFWLLVKYYVGRHIEPDNVIILPAHQGKGAGKKLMPWIYQSGRENGCVASELNCYVGNSAGHRLWLNEGY